MHACVRASAKSHLFLLSLLLFKRLKSFASPVQGEIGIDTGGPCFPLHCSSCSVPTMLSGAIASPNVAATSTVAVAANRGAGTYELHAGFITAASLATTATLASDASSENGYYTGMRITFEGGATSIINAYVGSSRLATFATITTQAANTAYKIEIVDVPTTGTASAGAGGSITLQTTAGANKGTVVNNYFMGWVVTITGGTGSGQSRLVDTSSIAGVLTVITPFTIPPDTTSTYVLHNPNVRGRCSAQNQIQAFGSGNCKGRATTTSGTTATCSFKFPYLKYPSLCPDDAEYTTALKEMYTEPTFGKIRADLQRLLFHADGLYSSMDQANKMVEGVTRVLHPNPLKTDTSTATAALPLKVATIEVEDAVALCGISVDGHIVVDANGNPIQSTLTAECMSPFHFFLMSSCSIHT
jgi:hypothetical protein